MAKGSGPRDGASRNLFGDLQPLFEAVAERNGVASDIAKVTQARCQALRLALGDVLEPTKDGARIRSQKLHQVVSRYRGLGFKRYRCYVRMGRASISAGTYDIIALTWNGQLLENPRESWGGDAKLWMGFREVSHDGIPVVPERDLPLTSTKGLEKSEHKFLSAEQFHWAQQPGWQVEHRADDAVAADFLSESIRFAEDLTAASVEETVTMAPLRGLGPTVLALPAGNGPALPAPEGRGVDGL